MNLTKAAASDEHASACDLRGYLPSTRVVSGLLVDGIRFGEDVWLVDLLGPVPRLDVFDADRHRFLAGPEYVDHRSCHCLGLGSLLLLRPARMELYNDVGHSLSPFRSLIPSTVAGCAISHNATSAAQSTVTALARNMTFSLAPVAINPSVGLADGRKAVGCIERSRRSLRASPRGCLSSGRPRGARSRKLQTDCRRLGRPRTCLAPNHRARGAEEQAIRRIEEIDADVQGFVHD